MSSHLKLLQHTASEAPLAALSEVIAITRRAHNAALATGAEAAEVAGGGGGGAQGGVGVGEVLPLIGMLYSLAGNAN